MTAVSEVRRRAAGARTGHAGTLDPRATGVLVIAIGSATKLIDQLMATDKRYCTTIDCSAFTATDDMEGERMEVPVASPPDEASVRRALARFVGTVMQKPPAFSAVKIDGKRAYAMARKGQTVEVQPREVKVHSMELIRYAWPMVEVDIHCGKGFYVRSLARELGEALGTGGHCTAIRRTAVGPFTLDRAVRLEDVPNPLLQSHVIPPEDALSMVRQAAGSA